MSASRCTTKVEEHAQLVGISTILQCQALALHDEWLVGLNRDALFEQEVRIATVGELEGNTSAVVVGL